MGENVDLRNALLKKKINALLTVNPWTKVELFDVTMLLDKHPLHSFFNQEGIAGKIDKFLSNVRLEWRSFQYEDLSAYLTEQISFPRDTYAFCLLTDYKAKSLPRDVSVKRHRHSHR